MVSRLSVFLYGGKNHPTKQNPPIKGQYAGKKKWNKDSKTSGIHPSLQECCATLECRARFLLPTKIKKTSGATFHGSWTFGHQAAHPEQDRCSLAPVPCQCMLCKYPRYCRTSKIALGVHRQAVDSYFSWNILDIYWSQFVGLFRLFPLLPPNINLSQHKLLLSFFTSNK